VWNMRGKSLSYSTQNGNNMRNVSMYLTGVNFVVYYILWKGNTPSRTTRWFAEHKQNVSLFQKGKIRVVRQQVRDIQWIDRRCGTKKYQEWNS